MSWRAEDHARLTLVLAASACFGCELDMVDQPRLDPGAQSSLFEDGRASRAEPEHTLAREDACNDEAACLGTSHGTLVAHSPLGTELTQLQQGQELFGVYCVPCHGELGDGHGVVIGRGFPSPPSYHIDRLRQAPDGYIFGVITSGFGAMFNYADDLTPEERWSIVGYVRALQLSQHTQLSALTPAERAHLERP